MEKNKKIKLTSEKFDVSELSRSHRILYYKEEESIIIKCSVEQALKANADGRAEIITASQAPRRYPDIFTNTSKPQFEGETRTIILRVPSDMYVFCCRQGNITAYLRSLIEAEMKKV